MILKKSITESVLEFRDSANNHNHFIISKFDTEVEIKSSATYNYAWQKSGEAMAPKAPPPPVLPALILSGYVWLSNLETLITLFMSKTHLYYVNKSVKNYP